MKPSESKYPLKIILSYLVLGALVVAVGFFLYSEFKGYLGIQAETPEDKKFIETGTLINFVYETDGLSKLALLTLKEEDFDWYSTQTDSLFQKIENIKDLTSIRRQKNQLDSVTALISEKKRNIEELRKIKISNRTDTSLDDILEEFMKLDTTMGKLTLERVVNNPSKLNANRRRFVEIYMDYWNSTADNDTTKVNKTLVDSMLAASRFIVSEAKQENLRARRSLQKKENELIRNDLNISEQLRGIIATFDAEVNLNYELEKEQREASVKRTSNILKLAAIMGLFIILLFTYIILTDFLKAERFRRNLKQEKQFSEDLLKSREQLISTVSHDLKTPLNTIVGYSGLIENTHLSEKQHYYIQQITSSSHYVTKLVDDLLDFSKLEAGKVPLESIPFSLETIIKQAGKASRDIHPNKPVELIFSIESSIKNRMFEGDPLRIRQIINNLVGNAFKFTEKGSVMILAKENSSNKNKTTVEISVTDTGIGISEEKQQHIFKEFTQAETDTATRFGGYGLGLAISKKLTLLLGGNLTVKSSPGNGSTFTVTFPLKNSSLTSLKPSVTSTSNITHLKAIIFDDDPSMAALLSELFDQMAIENKTYNSFEDYKSAPVSDFSFILTDIQMPETSGFEILNFLKDGKLSEYKDQPIIAMTGSREHSDQHYYDLGFSALLKKPFTKDELLQALHSIFPNKVAITSNGESRNKNDKKKHENFNLSLLESFLKEDDGLKQVLHIFYEQTEKDLIQLASAIQDNDTKALNAVAHRMLTMFRQIQATQAIPLLEILENSTEPTSKTERFELLEALRTKVGFLVAEMQA